VSRETLPATGQPIHTGLIVDLGSEAEEALTCEMNPSLGADRSQMEKIEGKQ
jgi:hypothetical protein